MVKMDKVMKTKIYIWAILSVCLAIVSCKKTDFGKTMIEEVQVKNMA